MMKDGSNFFETNHTTQQLFENMNSGFALNEIITDNNGQPIDYIFHDINPAFEKLTGLKKEDIIQKRVLEVLPQTEKYWIEKFGDVALTGTPIEYTDYSQNLHKYYETKAYSPKKGFFVVLFNDVTEKTRIKNKIIESENQLQATFDCTPAALFTVDENFQIEIINKSALNLGTTTEKMATGKKVGDALFCVNAIGSPDGCGSSSNCSSCQIKNRVNETFKNKYSQASKEIRHQFKNGSDFEPKNFILSTSYLPKTKKHLTLVSLQDITTLKKQEVELKQFQYTVQEKNEEYETLNEELKEQNEELQTLEEELRSNNEELYIANEKLSQSQERFNHALAVNNDGIFDWNVESGEVYFDNRYYTMAGYTPNEFDGSIENWTSRIFPEDLPNVEEALHNYLSGKAEKYDVQFRFKKKNHSWLWIRARIKVVEKGENGSPCRIVGTHSDISIQKELEEILTDKNKVIQELLIEYQEKNEEYEAINEELRQTNEELYNAKELIEESELKFRHLFDNAHAALYSANTKTEQLIECNKLLAEMLEYDSVEDCKKNYHGSFHYKNATDRDKILMELEEKGEFNNHIIEFITAKGNTIWIKISGRINKITGYLEGGILDITKLKNTEIELESNQFSLKEANEEYEAINEELRQTNEELYGAKEIIEESEKQFRLLFENMDDGFALHEIITNKNGDPINYKFIDVNNVFVQRVGLSRKQVIGKTALELFPNTEEKWIKRFGSIAIEGTPKVFTEYSKELDKYYETRSYCPKKGYFAATFTDVTEQKKREIELKEAIKKAEESERLKTAFLANMSHEIRTPLNGISGFISLLSPDLSEDKFLMYTNIIQKSNNQLLAIINDILDLSKIEAGTEQLIKETFDLNDVLTSIYNEFSIQIDKCDLDFQLIKENRDITINTDKTKFVQIISNLLSNANKFTKSGAIKFGYKIENNQIVYYVSDTGIGIEQSAQKDIFDYFRQLDNSSTRVYGGTGIGLSLVKSYVDLMGGKLWLKSTPGQGSTFFFTIDGSDFILPETKIKSKTNTTTNWKGKNILIVEDDFVSQSFLYEAITDFSPNIFTANDGLEAIEILKDNLEIDLILLDIKMPNLDGYATIKEIRKINAFIPVIAQTAFAFVKDQNRIKAAGFDAFLSKPVKIDKLVELVNEFFFKNP